MAKNNYKLIAKNKSAYFNYFIKDEVEVGIVLKGSEVKSLRFGKININDSYVTHKDNELFIYNLNIANINNNPYYCHKQDRVKKLLLHKKQIKKFIGLVKVKGFSIIATNIYFNEHNKIKLSIGLAKGKKLHDKRQVIKERDEKRRIAREDL